MAPMGGRNSSFHGLRNSGLLRDSFPNQPLLARPRPNNQTPLVKLERANLVRAGPTGNQPCFYVMSHSIALHCIGAAIGHISAEGSSPIRIGQGLCGCDFQREVWITLPAIGIHDFGGHVPIGCVDQISDNIFSIWMLNRAIGLYHFPGNQPPGADKRIRFCHAASLPNKKVVID